MSLLFSKILIALPENEECARSIAGLGFAFSLQHHASVRLLSVAPSNATASHSEKPSISKGASPKQREEFLKDLASSHTTRDPADYTIRQGDTPTGILAEAKEWGADLIVLGSRDKSWVDRLLQTSVSMEVQDDANCPVLIFPEEMWPNSR